MRVCKVARHSEALAVTFMVFLKVLLFRLGDPDL